MKDYLKLIRLRNLIFLGTIIALMHYAVVAPILGKYGLALENSTLIIILLEISALFIAAGGYVVNDYFDTKIDEINKPLKVIVGKTKTRKQAAAYFQVLWAIGIIAGITLSLLLKDKSLGFVFVFVPGLLWFYSSSYKRMFLIGNIAIALCAFLSIFLVAYSATAQLLLSYGDMLYETYILPEIYYWVSGFGLFAFLLTLLREIVKDMEDVNGDKEVECRTLPIVWGINASKIVIIGISLVTIITIGYIALFKIDFIRDTITLKYYLFGILIPFMAFFYLLGKAKTMKEYHQLSDFLKYIMGIGSLYSLFFLYLINLNYE